jgi:hypothetical protein
MEQNEMSMMKRDLSNRVRERLQQWCYDSEELYEMGKLKAGEAHKTIIAHLLFATTISIAKWMHPKADGEFIESFARLLKEAREEIAKSERRS